MSLRFPNGAFARDQTFSRDKLDAVVMALDRAIHQLEEFKFDAQEQVTLFNTNALKRVADAVQPIFQRLQTAVNGGFLVAATNDLIEIVEDGEVSFFIPEAARIAFRPTPFLAVLAPDEREDWAIGRLLGYNDVSGLLTIEILHLNGSGDERTGWTLAASSGVVEAVYHWMNETKAARDEVIAARTTVLQALADVQAAAILIQGGPVSSIDGETGAVTGIARTINHYTKTAADALLALKADAAAMAMALAGKVDVNAVLTGFLGLAPSANDFLQWKSGAWANRAPAQVKTDLGISSFAETLLDDTSQAAMQATLGMRMVQIGPKQTVPAGGVQAVVFNNIPSSGFAKFILVGHDVASENASTTSTLYVQVSTDNGSTFKTASGDYYQGTTAVVYLVQAFVPAANSTYQHGMFTLELIGLGNPARATAGIKAGPSLAGISVTNVSNGVPSGAESAMRVVVEQDNAFRCVISSGADIAAGSTFILYGVIEA